MSLSRDISFRIEWLVYREEFIYPLLDMDNGCIMFEVFNKYNTLREASYMLASSGHDLALKI